MRLCLRRREFIAGLGGAASWPLAARAQQSSVPLIGYLGITSPDTFTTRLQAFRQGLSETGFFEGRNVAIEYRWAGGQFERSPSLAADLVSRRPSVLVAAGATSPGLAAKAATTTIPIVFETKFEMVVNLKTAKALGLAVPPSILLRATEVIE